MSINNMNATYEAFMTSLGQPLQNASETAGKASKKRLAAHRNGDTAGRSGTLSGGRAG